MKIQVLPVGQLGTNCCLLEDESTHTAAVIDPGDEAGRILAQAQADGVEIKMILLTHAHFDHTGAVAQLCKALQDVPVYLHPADAAMLGGDGFPAVDVTTRPYDEGDTLDLDGHQIHVMHTPGHSPGSVTLRVDNLLFTGDTLFCGSCGRTDLPGGSYEQIMGSLKRLGELEGDYYVLPGHDMRSTLERERAGNFYLREAMGR